MFNPNENKNQHYVPVFWQKRFAGLNGELYRLKNNNVSDANPKKQMSSNWLYTIFDEKWVPSNILEQNASKHETVAAKSFQTLDAPGETGTDEDQIYLRWFIAFSVCRHPDTMSLGRQKGIELAYKLADAHNLTLDKFCESVKPYGLDYKNASVVYGICRQRTQEQLLIEAEEVEKLSPQDPKLRQQIAIDDETIGRVFINLARHNVSIIDAPVGSYFILGDTPFRVNLGEGFIIPISSKIALLWEPGATEDFPRWTRRIANTTEIEQSNQLQFDNACEMVIGPTKNVLEQFVK